MERETWPGFHGHGLLQCNCKILGNFLATVQPGLHAHDFKIARQRKSMEEVPIGAAGADESLISRLRLGNQFPDRLVVKL